MTRPPFEWLKKLDVDLARLARGAGALRLSFGLVLEALARRDGHHELGFSSVEAYGLEQCERSARWIQQTRSMARRLAGLPAIRHGVLSGRLSWSIAELVSRIATSEDESAWLLAARGRTVRQLRELSLSSVKDKRALARRLEALPQVARAVEGGEVGYECARLVTRVATESTSAAWVARAGQRTVKHLRGEIAAAELIARIGDEGAMPPTAEQMEAVESLAARVMSGAVFDEEDGVARAFTALDRASRSGRGRVTIRLRIRDGTYWHYKSRERLHRRYGPGGSFLRTLCIGFIETWQHALKSGVAYEEVYARDRFECASPVCSRHDLTPHHLKFRAHGGSDLHENLVSLCVLCRARHKTHYADLRIMPRWVRVPWISSGI